MILIINHKIKVLFMDQYIMIYQHLFMQLLVGILMDLEVIITYLGI